jgi:hypothetical protein
MPPSTRTILLSRQAPKYKMKKTVCAKFVSTLTSPKKIIKCRISNLNLERKGTRMKTKTKTRTKSPTLRDCIKK